MNELALFAGAGGGIQGGQLLGWRTVCAVEFEPYAASVLAARQNDGFLPPFPIWDDVRTFDGHPWRGAVDVVSGGFPCQDISVAGGGAGIDGERSGLWREMARIVGEVRSPFVFVENSPALTVRGLGRFLGDLAALGYDAEWGVLGASDVGAPHKRKRIWILAYAPGLAGDQWRSEPAGQQRQARVADGCGDVANPELPEWRPEREACKGLAREVCLPQREEGAGGPGKCGENMADTESVCGRPGLCQDEPERNRDLSCNESCHAPDPNLKHVHDPGLRAGEISQQQAACISGLLPDPDCLRELQPQRCEQKQRRRAGHVCCEISDTYSERLTRRRQELGGNAEPLHGDKKRDWWTTEPDVGRVAHGVAARVDRLKAIGNGQVPECMAQAWERLMERIEKHYHGLDK